MENLAGPSIYELIRQENSADRREEIMDFKFQMEVEKAQEQKKFRKDYKINPHLYYKITTNEGEIELRKKPPYMLDPDFNSKLPKYNVVKTFSSLSKMDDEEYIEYSKMLEKTGL